MAGPTLVEHLFWGLRESSQIRPKLASAPNLVPIAFAHVDQNWTRFAKRRPNFANVGRCGQNLTKLSQVVAQVDQHLADVCRGWPKLRQHRPKLGRPSTNVGRVRSKFAGVGRTSGRRWSDLARIGSTVVQIDQPWCNFGGPNRPIWVESGQSIVSRSICSSAVQQLLGGDPMAGGELVQAFAASAAPTASMVAIIGYPIMGR